MSGPYVLSGSTRLRQRREFYRRFGGDASRSRYGFGRAELHFLAWGLRRGAFGGRARPASGWWQRINDAIHRDSELAAAHVASRSRAAAMPAAAAWIAFFERPSAVTWYRAHGGSVARAYLAHRAEALAERPSEQRLMRRVLVRLLYAHLLVESGRHVRWPASLFDPRGTFVGHVVRVPTMYPPRYPSSGGLELASLVRGLLDPIEDALARPTLDEVGRRVALWTGVPELAEMIEGGRLHYPQRPPAPTRAVSFRRVST